MAILLLPRLTLAGTPNRAALVVQFGDGRAETRCIAFEEGEISGADLLARSGLDVIIDASSGLGVTVCQIEGEGCAFPAEPCFCRCLGGGSGCAYWNYYYRDPDGSGWTYSALGAVLRQVRPGAVEGWVWGDGHTPPADEFTFDAICAPPTPPPTDTPHRYTPTSSPIPSPHPPTPTPAQSTNFPTSQSPTPTPPPTADPGPTLTTYRPFALLLLALLAIAALTRRRRS